MRKRLVAVSIVFMLIAAAVLPGISVQAAPYAPDEETLALFRETLHQGLLNFDASISLSQFHIPCDDDGYQLILDTISDFNDVFYVSGFGGTRMGDDFYDVKPAYTDTKENVAPKLNAARQAANDMIADLDGLTDLQKALILHDRLALTVAYDTASANAVAPTGSDCYSMYGALVNHLAVCEGYAAAYSYMLDLLGIANRKCRSTALNHVWNIITINEKEYHVDVTYDDPMINGEDRLGLAYHDNFLRSGAGIYQNEHAANDFDRSQTDTTYDNYFWQNVKTGFQLVNGSLYYIDSSAAQLKRWTDGAEDDEIIELPKKWTANGGYYGACFSKLSSKGAYLFYNSDSAIYRVNPETGEVFEQLVPECGENEWVYAVRVIGNRLDYSLASSPNVPGTVYSVRLGYDRGDLNGDFDVNAQDRMMLSRFLADWDVEIADENQMDINRDGAVTAIDRAILARYLARWGAPYDQYFN